MAERILNAPDPRDPARKATGWAESMRQTVEEIAARTDAERDAEAKRNAAGRFGTPGTNS